MKKTLSFILVVIMCLGMMSTVFAAEFKFTDVNESDWFYNDVKGAVEMGLINGKSETEYKPNDNLTYAEAIKLAACMHQLYMDGAITLKNGTENWYDTYVDYCIDNGIIDKYYEYNEKATRSGYMVIFANALPNEALAKINSVADNSIPDVPMTRAFAPAVYKLYRAGILQGSDAEHNCKPFDNIKRSEVAAILSRMMDETKRVKFTLGEEEKEEVMPLTIKTQPEDVTIKAGEETVFEVEAEGGKTPYTYQWQSRENNLEWENCDSEDFGEGSKTEKYTVYTGPMSFTAEYRCIVTDAEGNTVTSEVAKLTSVGEEENKETEEDPSTSTRPAVTPSTRPSSPTRPSTSIALAIKAQPEGTTVKTGESATLSVTVEGGKAPYTYQWEYYARYGKSASWSKINSATENEVSVSQVGAGNVKYRCVITDAEGATVTSEECTVTWEDNGFLMYVEEVFNVLNKGTVLTGKITYGEIKTNDTIYIVAADGTKTEAVVTAIEMFNKILDEAQAGDSVGLLVPSVEKTAVASGNAIVKADSDYKITTTVVGTLTLLSKENGGLSNKIESGYQAQFYHASSDETGTITLPAEGLDPGATLEDVKVVLKDNLPRFLGQTFEIRIAGRKIGTFTVTEVKSLSTRPAVTPSTRPSVPTRPTTEKAFYADLTVMASPNDSGKIAYVANVFNGSGDYSYNWERSIDDGPWDTSNYKTNTLEMNARGKGKSRCKITDKVTGEVIYTPAIAPNIAAKYGPFVNVKNDTIKAVYVHPINIDTYNGMDIMYTSKDYELNAVVIGGTAPYTYQWSYAEKDSDSFEVIGTNESTIKLRPSKELSKLKCVVTDANGNTVTSEIFSVIVVIDLSGN